MIINPETRVLVVDDTPKQLQETANFARRIGYKVVDTVSNNIDALTKLRYQNIENIGKLRCNCAGDDFISYKSGEVSITPEKYGWCTIELLSKNGGRLLADSIYVQKLPSPVILAKNVSANKISKSRLLQQKSLKLTANHHNMGNVIYDISSIKATFIGIDGDMRTFEGANISLTAEQLERIKYIQINEVTVETRVRNFTVTEPLIIEII